MVVWLLATLGTASLTYAAVSQAGGAASDSPAMPVSAAEITARVSTTTTVASSSTTSQDIATSTTTSTTSVTTTTTLSTGSTTSTPSTTSTTTAPHTEWKTVSGVGVVGVSVSGETVSLVSASPVDPYHAEVEDNGPERVEVKFESESLEYQVRAEVRNGILEWEVTTSSDDD